MKRFINGNKVKVVKILETPDPLSGVLNKSGFITDDTWTYDSDEKFGQMYTVKIDGLLYYAWDGELKEAE